MKVESFLLCDDIRNEIGGKQSLMGVYGENIQFETSTSALKQWPKTLRVGIFIRLLLEGNEKEFSDINFKIHTELNENKTQIGEGRIDLSANPKKPHKLTIGIIQDPLLIENTGDLTFEINCFSNGKEIFLSNNRLSLQVLQIIR